MLIGDLLKNSADIYPDKPAIISGDQIASYKELDESANKIANAIIVQDLPENYLHAMRFFCLASG